MNRPVIRIAVAVVCVIFGVLIGLNAHNLPKTGVFSVLPLIGLLLWLIWIAAYLRQSWGRVSTVQNKSEYLAWMIFETFGSIGFLACFIYAAGVSLHRW
jgi:hypothetical protein